MSDVEIVHACNRRGITSCGNMTPGRAQTNVEKYPDNWDKVNCPKCISAKDKNSRRNRILRAAGDLAGTFMYYDRKEDSDLPEGEIEAAITAGEITIDEIIAKFRKSAFNE